MWTGKESDMQLTDEQTGIAGDITRISLQVFYMVRQPQWA